MMSMQVAYAILVIISVVTFCLNYVAFTFLRDDVFFKRAVLAGLLCIMLMIEKYTSRRANKP